MTKGRRFVSLRIKFLLMLIVAVGVGVLLGWLVNVGGEWAIEEIYLSDERQDARYQRILDDFETYVRRNNISIRQAKEIDRWAKQRNRVYLTICDEEQVLVETGFWGENSYYSAFEEQAPENALTDVLVEGEMYDAADEAADWTDDYGAEDEEEEEYANIRMIPFSDGVYEVYVIEYSEDPLYSTVRVGTYAVGIAVFTILMLLYYGRIINKIIRLSREVETVANGDLDSTITVRRSDEIGVLSEHVDTMRTSIIKQMRAEQEAWNANSDLITRMSHDIRTPLTVLLGFLELLDEGEYSEDESYRSYLNICKENAYQLKELADKLFQYFLVFGHKTYELKQETVDARMLLGQLIGEHEVLLQEQGWHIENEPLASAVQIRVDPVYFKRLFDNLFSNIEKYADRDSTVGITQRLEEGEIHIRLSNRIRPNPNPVESTNIGLKTCERIVQLMGGTFRTEREGETFLAELRLPICPQEAEKKEPERRNGTGPLPSLPPLKTTDE